MIYFVKKGHYFLPIQIIVVSLQRSMSMDYTLNIRGRLMSLRQPQVMGIVNITPDSFYAESRVQTEEALAAQTRRMLDEGAAIIDVGACSTRPGANPVGEEEERQRLCWALPIVRRTIDQWTAEASRSAGEEPPLRALSVDTFRPALARMAVEELGADIINDVGIPLGSEPATSDFDMLRMVSRLRVPYILMSAQPTVRSVLLFFADRVQRLRDMGHTDIILDPGFGFGKTLEQNYALLAQLERLHVMGLPLLVGVSRKSMIYRLLDTVPEKALNGTTALNAVALTKGASILRVHDVREAVECCRMANALRQNSNC